MFGIEVDFQLFPDNHVLGPQFSIGGMAFQSLAGSALFVNETAGERGIQFDAAGVEITLPVAVHQVSFRLGTFAGPVTMEYFDDAHGSLGANQWDFNNTFQSISGTSYLPLRYVRFDKGGGEGILRIFAIGVECYTAAYTGPSEDKFEILPT